MTRLPLRRVLLGGLIALLVLGGAIPFLTAQPIIEPASIQSLQPNALQVVPTPTRTPTPITVGNFVWDDADQDGRQDAGEPGLGNITVQLWNSTKTLFYSSTTTNSSGNYALVAPTPGDYRIRVLLPGAGDQYSPNNAAGGDDQEDSDINPSGLNSGFTDVYNFGSNLISILTIDAGIIKFRTATPTRTPTPVNIGNFVWDDLDEDGRQDASEPGLANVTVQLWNVDKTLLLDQTATNSSGIYTLQSDGPGSFRVRVILPGGSDQFSPKDQAGGDDLLDSDINPTGSNLGFTDVINIASNVISTTLYDAGIIKFRTATPTRTPTPINVGNFVWNDLDSDGRQDAGEPGLSGIVVQLWNSSKSILLDDAVTNSSGNYTLVAPLPGAYRIRALLPGAGDQFSPKDQAGGNDQQDSDINLSGINFGFTDVYNFGSNLISITTIDVGIRIDPNATPTPATGSVIIGNFVWNDLNGNGLHELDEPGVSNVQVNLFQSTPSLVFVTSTITNSAGNYTFTAATPGSYTVQFIAPPGTIFTSANVGDPDPATDGSTTDSDAATSGEFEGFTLVFTVDISTGTIDRLDAGLVGLAAPTFTATFDPAIVPTATLDPSITPTLTDTPDPLLEPTDDAFIFTDTPEAPITPEGGETPDVVPTPTLTPESVERFCDYPLPVGSVQGRILSTTIGYFEPVIGSGTDVVIPGGSSWWIIGAQDGYYQLWITCAGFPVWVQAQFVSPNFDEVWGGTPLPPAGN